MCHICRRIPGHFLITLFFLGVWVLLNIYMLKASHAGEPPAIPGVTFISNQAELDAVWGNQEPIAGGVAVNLDFYQTLPLPAQLTLDAVFRIALSEPFQPVYVYGTGLDATIANRFFGRLNVEADINECDPMTWAGASLLIGGVMDMCGASSHALAEARYRNEISDHNRDVVQALRPD